MSTTGGTTFTPYQWARIRAHQRRLAQRRKRQQDQIDREDLRKALRKSSAHRR